MRKDQITVGQSYAVRPDVWDHSRQRWRCEKIIHDQPAFQGSFVMVCVDGVTGEPIPTVAAQRMSGRDIMCPWSGYEEAWTKQHEERQAKTAAEDAVLRGLRAFGVNASRVAVGPADRIGISIPISAAHHVGEILEAVGLPAFGSTKGEGQ